MEDEAIHNIDELIDDLNIVKGAVRLEVFQEECPNVDQILQSVVNVGDALKEETTKVVIDKVLLTLLRHKSKQIVAKTAKAIAEIAKTHRGRKTCTTIELIRALINLLKEEDINILTQACSALANICVDNANGRKLVREQDCLKVIITILKKGIALDNVEGASFLRNEATKFLSYFLINQKAFFIKALEKDMLPILYSILELDFQNGIIGSQATENVCATLSILNNHDIIFLDERLTKVLVDIMTMYGKFYVMSMMCVEIFLGQAENENAKLVLAKAGVCELFLKLLEKDAAQCNDERTLSILVEVRDLIVLILTRDDCLHLLYSDGDGPVYRKLVEWLESVDEELQITAVLAMGSFARTDTHCKRMVEHGVHRKLEKLRNDDESDRIRIECQLVLLRVLCKLYRTIERIQRTKLADLCYVLSYIH